jgi:hypothetical protein
MQVSGTLDGSLGFYTPGDTAGGWLYTTSGSFDATLAGDTVTCASGITFQSSIFTAWTPGVVSDGCSISSYADYVDAWLETAAFGGVDAGDGATVVMTVPVGLLVASPEPGDYEFEAYGYNGTDNRALFTLTVGRGGSDGQAPPSVLQQLPLPAAGECTAIDDAAYSWGTGLSGGWIKAWGEWVNNRAGGWVCSRTLAWSTAQQGWVVE